MKIKPIYGLTVDQIRDSWWANFAFGVEIWMRPGYYVVQVQLGIFLIGVKVKSRRST